jgi:hypothetical protein
MKKSHELYRRFPKASKFPTLHDVDLRIASMDLDANECVRYDYVQRKNSDFYVIGLYRNQKFVRLLNYKY